MSFSVILPSLRFSLLTEPQTSKVNFYIKNSNMNTLLLLKPCRNFVITSLTALLSKKLNFFSYLVGNKDIK